MRVMAADQDHVVDIADRDAGVLSGDLARSIVRAMRSSSTSDSSLARVSLMSVLRAAGIRGDVRQVDIGLLAARQLDLGLFGGLLQALQGQRIVLQVDALVLLNSDAGNR